MTPEDPNALLRWARREFKSFYLKATARDSAMLDGLVLARAEYAAGIRVPRRGLSDDARRKLERDTDAREREFVRYRDAVRASDTFKALGDPEQRNLERNVLKPPLPAAQS